MGRAKRNDTETEPESYCAWSPTSGLLVTWDNTFFFSLIQFELAFLSLEAPNFLIHLLPVPIFHRNLIAPFLKQVSIPWLTHYCPSLECPVPLLSIWGKFCTSNIMNVNVQILVYLLFEAFIDHPSPVWNSTACCLCTIFGVSHQVVHVHIF